MFCNRIGRANTVTNADQVDGVSLYPIIFTKYDSQLYKTRKTSHVEMRLDALSLSAISAHTTTATPVGLGTPVVVNRDIEIIDNDDHHTDNNSNRLYSVSHTTLQSIQDFESTSGNRKAAQKEMIDSLQKQSTIGNHMDIQDCNKKLCIGTFGSIFIICGITILSTFISYIHNEYNDKCLNLNVDLERLE